MEMRFKEKLLEKYGLEGIGSVEDFAKERGEGREIARTGKKNVSMGMKKGVENQKNAVKRLAKKL